MAMSSKYISLSKLYKSVDGGLAMDILYWLPAAISESCAYSGLEKSLKGTKLKLFRRDGGMAPDEYVSLLSRQRVIAMTPEKRDVLVEKARDVAEIFGLKSHVDKLYGKGSYLCVIFEREDNENNNWLSKYFRVMNKRFNRWQRKNRESRGLETKLLREPVSN